MCAAQVTDRRPEVNILCFGDSLTEGYCCPTREGLIEFHPYTDHLQKLLEKDFDRRAVTFKVHNHGISGERVHDQMQDRLLELLRKDSTHYPVAVLQGGTNDLFLGEQEADAIADSLFCLHARLHERGAKTVAFTLPETGYDLEEPEMASERNRLNALIRQKSLRLSERVAVADIAALIPMVSLIGEEKRRIWDADGVHFSPTGYVRVAEVIYEALKPLLLQQMQLQ